LKKEEGIARASKIKREYEMVPLFLLFLHSKVALVEKGRRRRRRKSHRHG
jgi:hypothetical protein